MNTSKKIYFLSAFVLIIGCLALNLSYSLFVQTEEKEIVNASVPSLSYNLTIDDGIEVPENNKQYSITIPEETSEIITLKINNTGTADMQYSISLLEELTESQLVQVVDIEENDIIGTVASNTTKDVKLFIQNNENTSLNLTFNLVATYTTLNLDNEVDSKIIRDPKYSILLNNIIMNDTRIVKNENTPQFTGVETNEVGMYSAEDDYGTSWYFRGAQPYNYVNFAGFTWRIVRINGDGSIRLILDGTLDKVYRKNEDGTTSTIPAGSRTSFDSPSHYNFVDNAYVGYMYGNFTGNSTTYDEAHRNEIDSTIKDNIDLFYETYIENEESNYHFEKYLADTLFCGDKTLSSDFSITNSGFGQNLTSYSAAERLGFSPITSTATPTLECTKGITNTYSRYTSKKDMSTTTTKGVLVNNDLNYPIALLSADELVMAGAWGGFGTKANKSYYLYDSYEKDKLYSYWWTMSPSRLQGDSGGHVFILISNVSFETLTDYQYDLMGVRPVINLKPDVQMGGGNGTYKSPYTLEEIVE